MRGTELFPLLLAGFLLAASAEADIATVSQGDVRFGIDTALFDYTGTDTLGLEVYQQIGLEQLSMNEDSTAVFSTTAVLVSSQGDTAAVDQWISETGWSSGRSVVNSTVLPVTPGEYSLAVTVTDLGNGKQGTLERNISVEPITRLSQMELARTVVPSPEGSVNPLRKGNVLVFPAADGSYTLPEEHMAYFYLEVYGMGGETAQVQARLETASGETIFARPWVTVDVPEGAQAVSLIDSLDLRTVRNSGLHSVVFDLVQQEDTSEVRKDMMVARILEGGMIPIEVVDSTMDIPYPEEFRLILSQSELSVFDSLDDEAKSRFYTSYWQNAPEQRQLFEERCEESRRYASSIREGWQTDRGRVYVIYGPPDDIESVSFQGEQVPYEIWYYYGGANEQFVFADLSGFGDYEQVFSTVEGEVSYSNWEDMISTISQGGGR